MEKHAADRPQMNLSGKSEGGNKGFVSHKQYSNEVTKAEMKWFLYSCLEERQT